MILNCKNLKVKVRVGERVRERVPMLLRLVKAAYQRARSGLSEEGTSLQRLYRAVPGQSVPGQSCLVLPSPRDGACGLRAAGSGLRGPCHAPSVPQRFDVPRSKSEVGEPDRSRSGGHLTSDSGVIRCGDDLSVRAGDPWPPHALRGLQR